MCVCGRYSVSIVPSQTGIKKTFLFLEYHGEALEIQEGGKGETLERESLNE